jgi:chemotaxis protein MotB
MARKPKKEEHVNHERWLVSYADFMTLLFAFFTALYAMSSVDARKAAKMSISTRAAFNVDMFQTDKPMSALEAPIEAAHEAPIRHEKRKPAKLIPGKVSAKQHDAPVRLNAKTAATAYKNIQAMLDRKKLLEAGIAVTMVNNSVVLSLKDKAFFDPGGAHIRAASLPIIDSLAEALVPLHVPIRVEGHTDDGPPLNTRFSSNWDLSSERAVSVVEYLAEEYGYPPEAMVVAGYGSSHPLGDNKTPDGRAKNRRVDIVLIGEP